MYSLLYRHIIYPGYHLLKNDGMNRAIRNIRPNQWKDLSELKRLQTEKLNALLKYAFNNIPYYRHLFEKNNLTETDLLNSFTSIPLLTKKNIRENIDDLCSKQYMKNNWLVQNSTSGSTGEKLIFYNDKDSLIARKATGVCDKESIGIHLGDQRARLWGAPMDLNLAKSIRGRIHAVVTRELMLSSYDLSDGHCKVYSAKLKKLRPKLLVSYPTPLVSFCDYLEKNKITIDSLSAVICSAETLYPWQKEKIERILVCKVYNRYGCREFGDIAHACSCSDGLHVHIDRVFIELLDEQMHPVPPGEQGEIFITDLDNFGMPFIRYQIGDYGQWAKDKVCSCGRGYPLMKDVNGRTFDIVETPNNKLGGTFWTILFRQQPGIKQFQVIQKTSTLLVIKYVNEFEGAEMPSKSELFFREKIQEKCGKGLTVMFETVKEIEKTSSGKTRIVISELKRV